jgi:hypothetical protein
MTNIINFPRTACTAPAMPANQEEAAPPPYDFSAEELAKLYRWYSAMKYAFPQTQGVMTVCHDRKISAIGLYGEDGRAPNCLISKHSYRGETYLLWATEQDPPRRIDSVCEITERQIGAIAPPRNEASWLDIVGWMAIFAGRTTPEGLRAV